MQPHNSHFPSDKSQRSNGDPTSPDSQQALAELENRAYPVGSTPANSGTGLKLTIFAIVLAIALTVGFFIVQHRKASAELALVTQTTSNGTQATTVDVVEVQTAPPAESVGYPGDTRGWYESTIYARVSGYVGSWTADIGDHVKKDQVLATIDTPDLDAEYQSAIHQLAVSGSQVDVMQANADFAKTTFDRWRDSPKGVVSDQERDEKKAEYNRSMAQLKAAQAQVNADQANVERLKVLENYKNVTAPFDGVVTQRHIDIGDLVTAGSTSSTTSLYSVAQIDKIRVYVDVPQRASAGMVVGVPAVAVANEFPDRTFVGTVARTASAIDPATRTLHVEVDIDNPNGQLLPGMYVEVTFNLSHEELLQVPASALLFRASGPQVAVVGDDAKVHFHNVTIGIDNGDVVELASGVTAQEKVALNLSSQISEGDTVVPNDVAAQSRVAQSPETQAPAVAAAVKH